MQYGEDLRESVQPQMAQNNAEKEKQKLAMMQSQIPYDEQVIPTLTGRPAKKDGQAEGNHGGGGDQEEGKVEEISPENMKYAEQLIPVFGEDIVKKMFSRPWAIREEGLKECEDIVKKNGNDQTYF